MTRRASLPGASELFRRTSRTDPAADAAPEQQAIVGSATAVPQGGGGQPQRTQQRDGRTEQRRHDSKITVYLSNEEVLALEQARLTLRGTHGLPVDRGRIVREAVGVLLEDFDENGEESVLVRRLRGVRTGD